jgi:dihydrofolate reductase
VFVTDINGTPVPRGDGRWLMAAQFVPDHGERADDFTRRQNTRVTIRTGVSGGDTRGEDMSKVRVNAFTISADGFGAGTDQSREQPLGRGGEQLHEWLVQTRTFQRDVQRRDGGTTGADDDFAARSFENLGAWIMGRNMFGPVRGPWADEDWKGWWGANPPYHVPVFVLTHHPRRPLEMEGGTIFHFVTDGIEAALYHARAAAQGKDVRIGGGTTTIRQYLEARLIDEMHLAISPLLLGCGEPLFAGIDFTAFGYRVTEHVATGAAMHLVVGR